MAVENPYMTPGELLYKFNEAVWTKGAKGLVTLRGVYSMQDQEVAGSSPVIQTRRARLAAWLFSCPDAARPSRPVDLNRFSPRFALPPGADRGETPGPPPGYNDGWLII